MSDWIGGSKQWAKGVFYRKDGLKQTLDCKMLVGTMAIAFVLAFIGILLGDSQPVHKVRKKVNFSEPEVVEVSHIYATLAPKPTKVKTKRRPVKSIALPGFEVVEQVHNGSSKSAVKVGLADLEMETSDGPARAKFLQMTSGTHPQLTKGSTLVGMAKTVGSRLQIRFDQVLSIEGRTTKIEAYACDSRDRTLGIQGSSGWSKTLKILAALGLNIASGAGETLSRHENDDRELDQGETNRKAILGGLSRAALEQARYYMSDVKSSDSKVKVQAGQQICFIVASDE